MSYSSVDLTTMMPRTVEAARMQGQEINQTQHAAEQTAVQFQSKVEHDAHQAVESKKSETEDYDSEEGSGKRHGGDSRRRKKKQEEKAPMAPRSNSSFDITI